MAKMEIDAICANALSAGIAAMGLAVSPGQQQALLRYTGLLHHWNRAYNLTAVRDPFQMISRHLLDSLVVTSHLQGNRILDVGTGPGLPGIPLAITLPGLGFTLLDSNGKKIRFVRQAMLELRLENVTVVQKRIEDFSPEQGFDTVIARAFAPLPDIFRLTQRLLRPGGRLLAMKGRYPKEELKALEREGPDVVVVPLQVPQLEERRHAVLIRTKAPAHVRQ